MNYTQNDTRSGVSVLTNQIHYLLSLNSYQITQAAIVLLLIVVISSSLTAKSTVPEGVTYPWVDNKSTELFANWWVGKLHALKNVRKWLAQGSEKFLKKGKSYALPDFYGRRPYIIVPYNKTKLFIDRPDGATSLRSAANDIVVSDYSFPDAKIFRDHYGAQIMYRFLPRQLPRLVGEIWDEVKYLCDKDWGVMPGEWKEININDTSFDIVVSLASRMLIGSPLCKNENFLFHVKKFTIDVFRCMAIDALLPRALTGVLGPYLVSLPNRWHVSGIHKHTLPLIKKRLDDLAYNDDNPDEPRDVSDDYISWHIRFAQKEGNPSALDPHYIASSMLSMQFATASSTRYALTNLLLDIFSTDPAEGIVEGLREEIERVDAEHGHDWTKQALSKLHRTDSAIKESLRYSGLMAHGSWRKVVAKDGLKDEESGMKIPCGAMIGLDFWTRHHDPEIYPQPDKYDAFRFSRPREEHRVQHPDDKTSEEYLGMKSLDCTYTASDTFLVFGMGKYACPGRFFVTMELKLLLVYVIMNYDVELLSKRPSNHWIGGLILPGRSTNLRVRRRADAPRS
ncbi:Cytochrome P450 monooxygenase [Lachnellula occidentalis]|uniref:Cytochrome P450 monooxygenase n=1 Tax=Lachnellula occidentalis TaxID=215460 RepID=A0A8H8S6A6_9HELO|nr:Cytochrome P450 monooxygenase [Lachnellula occidentalis]